MNDTDSLGEALYAFDGTANLPADFTNPRLTYLTGYAGQRYYHDGVGNSQDNYFPIDTIEQTSGWGMGAKRNGMIGDLVKSLAAGDANVDVVGFSRGAIEAVWFAQAVEKLKEKGGPPFCKLKSIRFMGLYDPVTGPGRGDPSIPKIVDHTSIAYSLDEQRTLFAPSIYSGPNIVTAAFRGSHSDVGGGYPDRGLANITLEWMTDQGHTAGGPFVYPMQALRNDLQWHQEDDWYYLLYGHRSGLGGIPNHPSVDRLKYPQSHPGKSTPGPAHHYYIDSIAPGNDVYNVGEEKF